MSKYENDFEKQNYFHVTLWFACSLICGLLSFYIYFKTVKAWSRTFHLIKKFPGPKTLPIFGNSLQVLVPNHELLKLVTNWTTEYGQTFRVWLCHKPYIMVGDLQGVEKLLSSSVHIQKSKEYDVLHPWLRTGALTSSGEKWHKRRKLLTPTFHFQILETFVDIFNEKSEIFVNLLSSECRDTPNIFNLSPYITRCALDIISETAMGKSVNAQKEKSSEYVQCIYSYGEILMQRMLQPWLRLDFIWKYTRQGRSEKKYLQVLHTFTDKVIRERKADRKLKATQECKKLKFECEATTNQDENDIYMHKKQRKAFLDLLLDAAENTALTDLDIREEVDTFMFEGHDTTSASLGWTLFLLGKNPEIQQKVKTELDAIFGEECNRAVNMNDASRMKYLECCIKESLRLYPSVPILGRYIQEDIDLGNGLTVPAGIGCYICPYVMHRNPDVFSEPEKYNPDRFLTENSIGRHPYSYVPFSAGHRNCIGQKFALLELKVVLAHLLRAYRFEAMDNLEELKVVPDLILRPKDGLRFRVFKRSSTL